MGPNKSLENDALEQRASQLKRYIEMIYVRW